MMKNVSKYQRQYFMPPVECNDWVKKTYVDKAPIWCSVDLRDGNQALIVPMLSLIHIQMCIRDRVKETTKAAKAETAEKAEPKKTPGRKAAVKEEFVLEMCIRDRCNPESRTVHRTET